MQTSHLFHFTSYFQPKHSVENWFVICWSIFNKRNIRTKNSNFWSRIFQCEDSKYNTGWVYWHIRTAFVKLSYDHQKISLKSFRFWLFLQIFWIFFSIQRLCLNHKIEFLSKLLLVNPCLPKSRFFTPSTEKCSLTFTDSQRQNEWNNLASLIARKWMNSMKQLSLFPHFKTFIWESWESKRIRDFSRSEQASIISKYESVEKLGQQTYDSGQKTVVE